MTEVRCTKCSKLLYKINMDRKTFDKLKEAIDNVPIIIDEQPIPMSAIYALTEASKIEIKCPRCGEMNTK